MTASRYHIGRLIKRGGMAEVYEGSLVGEGGFARRVAIKRLLPGYTADDAAALADEARIASQLHHAGIVGVLDFGTLDGAPFIVTEWVDGVDVAGLVALAEEHRLLIPAEVALRIAAEVGSALAHAHDARDPNGQALGIVHRDVSPENVLVSWTGEVKLTDFGIARAPGRRAESRVGEAKGKLGFMAPEQLRGEDVGARCDIFSLGCLLHFVLAKTSPLVVAPELAAGELLPELDPLLPDDVRAIVERAAAIDPRRRYSSAAEMAEACASAALARATADSRAVVAAFLLPLKPRNIQAPVRKARAGDLLEVALVSEDFDSEPNSSLSGPRRFTSIVATQEYLLANDAVRTERAPIPVITGDLEPSRVERTEIIRERTLNPSALAVTGTIPSITVEVPTLLRTPQLGVAPNGRAARRRKVGPFLIAGALAIPAGLLVAFVSTQRGEARAPQAIPAQPQPSQPQLAQPQPSQQLAQPQPSQPQPSEQPQPSRQTSQQPQLAQPQPSQPQLAQPKPSKRAKPDGREESDLRAILAQRGLELGDLAALPETEPEYRAYKEAKKSGDRRRMASALANIKTSAETAPIPLALVKAKLQRVQTALHDAASTHAESSLEPLYADYLELRSAARAGATPEECENLIRRARILLDRIPRVGG